MAEAAEKKKVGFADVAVNISRIIVAAVFIFSGFVKAVDPVGTQIKLQDYMTAFGIGGFMTSDILLTACILAGIEFLLGIYMLFGVYRKGTSVILLIMMLLFTPLTLYLALKNPVSDCGCFGDALVLTNWQTFIKNVVLLLLIILLVWKSRLIAPLVGDRRSWLVTLATVLLIGHFMLSNIRDLPVFDFRPYKVGTDLRKAVLESPDGTFDDFYLMSPEMEDCTEEILGSRGYTFLVVAPHLEEASEDHADMINDLYDYCTDAGYNMVGITSSGSEQVEKWNYNTGASYRFMHADEIPLETMIRSNPGIVVIKDGVIQEKWSHFNIPRDEQLPGRMEQLKHASPWAAGHKGLLVALYFILPYLLILLIDLLAKAVRKPDEQE